MGFRLLRPIGLTPKISVKNYEKEKLMGFILLRPIGLTPKLTEKVNNIREKKLMSHWAPQIESEINGR